MKKTVKTRKVCRACGVPFAISKNHRWTNNGLLITGDGKQRLIIVERILMERIIDNLEAGLSQQARDILRETKAFDAKEYVKSIIGWRENLIRWLPLLRRGVYQLLIEFSKALGLARVELMEYRTGKLLYLRCRNYYNLDFFSGDIIGAFIALEGKPPRVEIERSEDYFDIWLEENTGGEDPTKGYVLQSEKAINGNINYKRCGECGVPLPISFFQWNMEEGTIRDTRSGENVFFIDIAGINLAIERLREVYRDTFSGELDDMMARLTKRVVDSFLPQLEWKYRHPEEKVRDLFFLAFRGMGNPIYTLPTKRGMRIRVENPFNYAIVAGLASSFVARNQPSSFTWEKIAPGVLEVNLWYK